MPGPTRQAGWLIERARCGRAWPAPTGGPGDDPRWSSPRTPGIPGGPSRPPRRLPRVLVPLPLRRRADV